jgi:hypothetical protein
MALKALLFGSRESYKLQAQLLGRFEKIAINKSPPPIARIKMSPVLSLGSDFLPASCEFVGGAGKRNFDFN